MRRQLLLAVLLALFIATSASAGSNAFAPGQLVPTYDTPPKITGPALQGQTFTASADTKNGPAPTYSFQWVRCSSSGTACAAIDKATLQTYLLTATDVGDTIRVAVTATNKNGSTIATSDASPVVTTNTASTGTTTTTTTTSSTTPTTTTPTTTTPTPTTTTTTTTTTPSPSGTIKYQENWESGTLDTANWVHQCRDTLGSFTGDVARGTATPDSSTSDRGVFSGRFDVPGTTGRQACEFLHSRQTDVGTNDYFSLAFKLPSGYAPPQYVFENISQLNYYGINSAPMEVMVNWNGGILLLLNTGNCTPSTGCANYSGLDCCSGYGPRGLAKGPFWVVPSNQVTPGTWYEVIIHVYWTVGNDGIVESWYRPRGGAWTKTIALNGGFPTLQWGLSMNEPGVTYTPSQISGKAATDKFGIYRGAASFATSIWHDSFCRATTFDAAASCVN